MADRCQRFREGSSAIRIEHAISPDQAAVQLPAVPGDRGRVGAAMAIATIYEQKFAEFLRMCDEARNGNLDAVVIDHPEVLGDTYAEIRRMIFAASSTISILCPITLPYEPTSGVVVKPKATLPVA